MNSSFLAPSASQLRGCLDSFLALQPRKQAALLLLLVYERHHAGLLFLLHSKILCQRRWWAKLAGDECRCDICGVQCSFSKDAIA